jgi:hypothetical protein
VQFYSKNKLAGNFFRIYQKNNQYLSVENRLHIKKGNPEVLETD